MRAFRLLWARRARRQPLRAAIAAVAVAAGVCLAVAILVTSTSVQRSVEGFGRTLAGPAELRLLGATTRGGLSPEAIAAAEEVDGVEAVAPVVQAVTLGGGEDPPAILALGIDCRAQALFGDFGCDDAALAAAGDGIVAVGPGLDRGSAVRSETGRLTVGDELPVVEALGDLNDGRVAVFSLTGAQARFARGDRVDVAYVRLAEGTTAEEVRAPLAVAVGSHNRVVDATDAPPEADIVLIAFLPLFGLLGLFGLATGAVLVRNTTTLALEERRRQLAILGALGARRRSVVLGAVGEAAVLGVVGGVLGAAAGAAVAGPLVTGASRFTEEIAGITIERHVTAGPLVAGVLLGALVAGLTAVLPALRATRLDVAAELSGRGAVGEATPPRLARRLAVATLVVALGAAGCAAAAAGGAIEPWQARVGPLAFLVVSVATPLAGASLAPILVRRLAGAARRSKHAAVVLGVADLVRDPRRTGIMAVAVAAPIIVGFGIDGFTASARAPIEATLVGVPGTVSVSGVDIDAPTPTALLPDEAIDRLATLPEVGAVRRAAWVQGRTASDYVIGIQAVEGGRLEGFGVLDGSVDAARLDAGEVAIGPGLARETGARAGDRLDVATPDGVVALTVMAVVDDGDFGGFGVTVDHGRLQELFGPLPASFVAVEPADGVGEVELAAAVRRAAPSIDPDLQALTKDEVLAAVLDSIDGQMLPFRAMQQSLQLVAIVAVVTTLLLAGYQRRREHGLLAAVGARPPDLRRLVLTEAAVVGVVGVLNAAIAGPIVLWSMLQVVPILVGLRGEFAPDWSVLVTGGAIAVVLALVAALWPAERAARVPVLEALRYE